MSKLNSWLIFLFVSLLLLQNANAALPNVVTVPIGAVSIALLALTVSFDVVAIGYVVSKIFPGSGVGEWLRNEYWETIKSALLIVGIFSAIALMSNVSSFFYAPVSGSSCLNPAPVTQSYTLVNAACAYLSQASTNLGESFNYLLGASAVLGALNSLNIEAYVPIPAIVVGFKFGFKVDPYQNNLLEADTSGQYQSLLNDIIDYIAFPVAALIYVQSSILPYLFVLGIEVLIPIGLVLRAFPFLRGIGGTLVAIGIAISIIYPSVLVIFNSPITNALQNSALATPSPSCGGGIGGLFCSGINFLFSIFPSGAGASDALGSISTIYPTLNGIVSRNMFFILQFVLFVLDLAIVFSLGDGIANMLGGSLQNKLSLGGKLKLA